MTPALLLWLLLVASPQPVSDAAQQAQWEEDARAADAGALDDQLNEVTK